MTQPAILADVPRCGRFLTLTLAPGADAADVLARVAALEVQPGAVLGLGAGLMGAAGKAVPGLHPLAAVNGPGSRRPGPRTTRSSCAGRRA